MEELNSRLGTTKEDLLDERRKVADLAKKIEVTNNVASKSHSNEREYEALLRDYTTKISNLEMELEIRCKEIIELHSDAKSNIIKANQCNEKNKHQIMKNTQFN